MRSLDSFISAPLYSAFFSTACTHTYHCMGIFRRKSFPFRGRVANNGWHIYAMAFQLFLFDFYFARMEWKWMWYDGLHWNYIEATIRTESYIRCWRLVHGNPILYAYTSLPHLAEEKKLKTFGVRTKNDTNHPKFGSIRSLRTSFGVQCTNTKKINQRHDRRNAMHERYRKMLFCAIHSFMQIPQRLDTNWFRSRFTHRFRFTQRLNQTHSAGSNISNWRQWTSAGH